MADYAFQWQPDALRWFVNRRLVHEVTGMKTPIPSRPSKVFLNIRNAAGQGEEDWLGSFEYAGQPLLATFEHVAFTKFGLPCQYPTSVLCAAGGQQPYSRPNQ
jgi:endo-1,3-1,4-beta-glycanase ExoK